MSSKFVVRLLGQADELLGWTEVHVTPASGGRFVARRVLIPIDEPGVVTSISIHWTDLDVARRITSGHLCEVAVGQVYELFSYELWRVEGEPGVPLPAVTVHASVFVAPATGHAGIAG